MRPRIGFLASSLLFLALGAGAARGQGAQTDWSGGPGQAGPVSAFGLRFDDGDLAWHSVTGQLALRSRPRPDFPQDVLVTDADRPPRLAVADVTGDGFADIVLCDPIISPFNPNNLRGGVYVWQNDGQDNWTRTVVTESFYGARYVDTVDLDKDGDLDVIAAAFYGEIDPPPPPPSTRNGRFAWFENLDGTGSTWMQREIGELFWGANHVAADDVDGDGDLDLIGCSTLTDGIYEQDADVVWFENLDGGGANWAQHDVSTDFNDAFEVRPADVDGDLDVDLVVSGYDRFEWFESLDGSGDRWVRHVITPTITGAGYFDLGDLDGDGDVDLLGSGLNNAVLGVWLNNGTGQSWGSFIVGPFFRGFNVELADIDGDGDLDAVSAKESGVTAGQLAWAENLGDGTAWILSNVDLITPSNPWARAGDVDRDGKPELVACFEDAYNVGVQLAAYTLTDFVSDGSLRSSILDGGSFPDWGAIAWDADVPGGTSLVVEVRGSNDVQDPGSFVPVPSSGTPFGDLIDPSVRYIQYRVSLTSGDPEASSVLREIAVETRGPAGVHPDGSAPRRNVLHAPYPNPFNPQTSLTYELATAGEVRLTIYSTAGRLVRTLERGDRSAGRHEVVWDGRDARGWTLPSGTYLVRLETAAGVESRTVMLLR